MGVFQIVVDGLGSIGYHGEAWIIVDEGALFGVGGVGHGKEIYKLSWS